MSHDRGCSCGLEPYEYRDCKKKVCSHRDGPQKNAVEPKRLISIRASRTLKLIRAGRFYPWTPKPGPALRELAEAGLIVDMMRVKVVERYFVPAGTKPFEFERFPEEHAS